MLWVKLLDPGRRVLQQFRGESTITTYLVRVASRIVFDGHVARCGRWRPSAAVRRMGPAAIALARRVERDGYPLPEDASGMALVGWRYCPRRFVPLSVVEGITDSRRMTWLPDGGPLGRRATRRRIRATLRVALATLTPDERRLLALRFGKNRRVSQIARQERCEAMPLYRRYDRILKKIGHVFRNAGIDADLVEGAIEPLPGVPSSLSSVAVAPGGSA
jgi:DNA-directed RNA polymerase specialized sigma24 family protein